MNYYFLFGALVLFINTVVIIYQEHVYQKTHLMEARANLDKTVREYVKLSFIFYLVLISYTLRAMLT